MFPRRRTPSDHRQRRYRPSRTRSGFLQPDRWSKNGRHRRHRKGRKRVPLARCFLFVESLFFFGWKDDCFYLFELFHLSILYMYIACFLMIGFLDLFHLIGLETLDRQDRKFLKWIWMIDGYCLTVALWLVNVLHLFAARSTIVGTIKTATPFKCVFLKTSLMCIFLHAMCKASFIMCFRCVPSLCGPFTSTRNKSDGSRLKRPSTFLV